DSIFPFRRTIVALAVMRPLRTSTTRAFINARGSSEVVVGPCAVALTERQIAATRQIQVTTSGRMKYLLPTDLAVVGRPAHTELSCKGRGRERQRGPCQLQLVVGRSRAFQKMWRSWPETNWPL